MFKYAIKRILTFIPMLIAISLLSFVISINAPGDPVERLSKAAGNEGSAEKQSGASKKIKQELRKKLGLDLPIFYFSVTDIASSDSLYKIEDKYHKKNLEALTHQSGNWQAVSDYYHDLLQLQKAHQKINIKEILLKDTLLDKNIVTEASNQFGVEIGSLLETSNIKLVEAKIIKMNQLVVDHIYLTQLSKKLVNVKESRNNLIINSSRWKTYVPNINFYGTKNQYHLWLFGNNKDRGGLLRGDFGISYIDSQPIQDKIWQKVGISFSLSLFQVGTVSNSAVLLYCIILCI